MWLYTDQWGRHGRFSIEPSLSRPDVWACALCVGKGRIGKVLEDDLRTARGKSATVVRAAMEALEPRSMLSAGVTVADNGVLRIEGSRRDDHIFVYAPFGELGIVQFGQRRII